MNKNSTLMPSGRGETSPEILELIPNIPTYWDVPLLHKYLAVFFISYLRAVQAAVYRIL